MCIDLALTFNCSPVEFLNMPRHAVLRLVERATVRLRLRNQH